MKHGTFIISWEVTESLRKVCVLIIQMLPLHQILFQQLTGKSSS